MNFDQAFEIIIGHEGGYVNDQRDPGGETKFGISKRAYPAVDIYNLTLDHAKIIYKRDYWDELECDSLPDTVRLMVFDCGVNCGRQAAKKLIQKSAGTAADGVIGPKTRQAIAYTPPEDLAKRFAGYWIQYYTDLKQFDIYGKGWVRRIANDLIGR